MALNALTQEEVTLILSSLGLLAKTVKEELAAEELPDPNKEEKIETMHNLIREFWELLDDTNKAQLNAFFHPSVN